MLRHRGARYGHSLSYVAHRAGPATQTLQDSAARWVSKCIEGSVNGSHGFDEYSKLELTVSQY